MSLVRDEKFYRSQQRKRREQRSKLLAKIQAFGMVLRSPKQSTLLRGPSGRALTPALRCNP